MSKAPSYTEQLESWLPFNRETVDPLNLRGKIGLVIVDPVVGFTRKGNLSDPERMVPMVHRIRDTFYELKDRLDSSGRKFTTLIFRDS